jgi:hypothetical protein
MLHFRVRRKLANLSELADLTCHSCEVALEFCDHLGDFIFLIVFWHLLPAVESWQVTVGHENTVFFDCVVELYRLMRKHLDILTQLFVRGLPICVGG